MVRGQQDLSSFGQEPIGSGRRVLDVGEVAAIIDELLLDERLIECRVRGEITNCKHHTSGHCYFSLSGERDGEPAQVPCVCWRRDAARLKDELRDGRTVIAFGSIANYAAGGRYQFYVCDVERAGIGEKFLQVERWRRELAKEGCFSEEKKRPLPRFPTRVGVVTSPTGAVLHDILNVLGRRFPVEVLLSPTPVQGDGAEVEIAAAIGRVDGRADVPRALLAGSERADDAADDAQRVAVVVRQMVGDAGGLGVQIPAAELLGGDDRRWPPSPAADHRGRSCPGCARSPLRRSWRARRHRRPYTNRAPPRSAECPARSWWPGCRRCGRSGRGREIPRPGGAGTRRRSRPDRCTAAGSGWRSPAPAGAS